MFTESALVLDGSLSSDGTIRLDLPPDVPPGRVRIALRLLPPYEPAVMLLPDYPGLDDAISAPHDLPLSGVPQRVYPRQARDLLPDALTGSEEDSE